jgi:hypothetical protein
MSSSSSPIHARAVPSRVSISESYTYEQGRIRDDDFGLKGSPEAKLEVVVPYDGNRYVTEETLRDVLNQEPPSAPSSVVQIGHLVFSGADRSNVGDNPDVARHGSLSTSYSMPLQIPIDSEQETSDVLNSGRAATATTTYRPDPPRLDPLRVKLDADDVTVSSRILSPETSLQFDRGLRLRITVIVRIPVPEDMRGNSAILPSRIDVGIQWPTPTSLKSLSVPNEDTEADAPISEPDDLRYNPDTHQIEWTDRPNLEKEKIGDASVFQARLTYVLDLLHPGELADQHKLKGTVRVRVSDYLLSGLDVNIIDALGHFSKETSVERRTELKSQFAFSLDDVFNSRKLRPYFQLNFDGVIPNEGRIRDLKLALKNQGFDEGEQGRWTAPEVQDSETWLLPFTRKVGMDTMTLVAWVIGKEYRGEVQTDTGRGETYRAEQRSGEMVIHLYGFLPRNDQSLIREINAVHRSLYDVTSYVRSRR